MRKKILGLALATFLIAVGLLATTAIVGGQGENKPKKQHIFVFESRAVTVSREPGPEIDLPIGTGWFVEGALFREGGEGDPIGFWTASVLKTTPAGTLKNIVVQIYDFTGMGTLYATSVGPNSLGRVNAITGGTGEFQGANGQCTSIPGLRWTCDLGIFAPEILD